MSASRLKWGIASCGLISHDFCNALNIVKQEHEIVAAAARDVSRAHEFSCKHGITKFYGSYEELAQDPDVEVVYVGTIHPTHYAVSKLMLEGGKHVLCEKPMTLSAQDTTRLIQLARERRLFLMEGIWSRCMPAYERVRQELNAGTVGTVQSLIATFCVPVLENWESRMVTQKEGASVLLAVGLYLLQLSTLVFGREPCRKTFTGHALDSGVDEYACITLQYDEGKQVAHMICDGRLKGNNTATITGDKGTIIIEEPFHTPLGVKVVTTNPSHTKAYTFELPGSEPSCPPQLHEMYYGNSENFTHEIQHIRDCIRNGRTESELMPHADSIHIASLMDDGLAAIRGAAK